MDSKFVYIYGCQSDYVPRREIRCKINDMWINGHIVKRGLVDDYRFYPTSILEEQKWDGFTIKDDYVGYHNLEASMEIDELSEYYENKNNNNGYCIVI